MMRASAFGWPRSVLRRGGNPPAPAFPRRGKRERGRPKFLAAAGYFRDLPGGLESGPHGYAFLSPSAVQSRLDAVAPQHLKMIQCLFPPLHRVPFLNHVS